MELVFLLLIILIFFIIWNIWLTRTVMKVERDSFESDLELTNLILGLEQDVQTIGTEVEMLSGPKLIRLHWMKK